MGRTIVRSNSVRVVGTNDGDSAWAHQELVRGRIIYSLAHHSFYRTTIKNGSGQFTRKPTKLLRTAEFPLQSVARRCCAVAGVALTWSGESIKVVSGSKGNNAPSIGSIEVSNIWNVNKV